MQEVEAVADKVIILNKGNIVFKTDMNQLKATNKSLEMLFREVTSS
jgi:ABC-type Na+ transport system ATPase subunit NatA